MKWLAVLVMLGTFLFSGFLVFLGMLGNKIALFAGLLGIAWKIILLFFGGWLYVRLRRYLGRRVVEGGDDIPVDPD